MAITRRDAARGLALTLPLLPLAAREAGAATANPGKDWERVAPEAAGFRAGGFEPLAQLLYTLPTTALMVVKGGRIAYSYGDIAQVSYLASARKSVLSMLYGKYVQSGVINLDRSMGELGIDEDDSLLPVEKTAKIRDLLISSSGVYHPAGSPGSDPRTPSRGSKPPGSFFFYNNWDFNVLGFLFQKLTGKSVFQALQDDLATPLGMQDFDINRQRLMGYQNQSRYLAYHLFLSGRDMARLGVLMAQKGNWNGKQIIPAAWVADSTQERVKAADIQGKGSLGYAYLWWIPENPAPGWAGAFMADGNFGQYILVLPASDLVIVHRRAVTDEFAIARNLGQTLATPPGISNADMLKIADLVLAARAG